MKENLFKKTEKTLYDYKNLDLRIENVMELWGKLMGYFNPNREIIGHKLGL